MAIPLVFPSSNVYMCMALPHRSTAMVPRLVPCEALPESPQEWLQLRPEPKGSLANLMPKPVTLEQLAPGPGEVTIRVQAIGANFRDVLNVSNALLMYRVVPMTVVLSG